MTAAVPEAHTNTHGGQGRAPGPKLEGESAVCVANWAAERDARFGERECPPRSQHVMKDLSLACQVAR